jgi:hypothetical protein
MDQSLREYTAQEVATHNQAKDCWVTVNGLVLDVTGYLDKHPGGAQLIARSAGLDVTRDFAAMFHSVRAKAKLEELCIGRLRGSSAPTHLAPSTAVFTTPSKKGPYGFASPNVVPLPLASHPVLRADAFIALRVLQTRLETSDCHIRVQHNGETRSYTPVAWRRGSFELLIKRYPEPHVLIFCCSLHCIVLIFLSLRGS